MSSKTDQKVVDKPPVSTNTNDADKILLTPYKDIIQDTVKQKKSKKTKGKKKTFKCCRQCRRRVRG